MAIWVIRSRTIAHHLSKKMGLLGVLNLSSWTSTTSSFQSSSSTMPHAFFGDSATHFPVPRFKSTEAERELDTKYINQGGGDQVFLICCFCFPGFFMLVCETLRHYKSCIDKYHMRLVKIIHYFAKVQLYTIGENYPSSAKFYIKLKTDFFFFLKKKKEKKKKETCIVVMFLSYIFIFFF